MKVNSCRRILSIYKNLNNDGSHAFNPGSCIKDCGPRYEMSDPRLLDMFERTSDSV